MSSAHDTKKAHFPMDFFFFSIDRCWGNTPVWSPKEKRGNTAHSFSQIGRSRSAATQERRWIGSDHKRVRLCFAEAMRRNCATDG